MNKFISSLLLASLVILGGCSGVSEEEAFESVETMVETAFEADRIEVNEVLDSFRIFIPEHFEIIEDSVSNLIFADDDQAFILFYNTLEDKSSDLFYLGAEANDNYSLLETFEDEERFGYLQIAEKEESYELEVGIGNVKITTQTTLKDMEDSATDMMLMINSIEFDQ